jgi:1-acyl-sn-glycerol-3-phosphate acyltransferase
MLIFRSVLFNIAFYINLSAWLLMSLPCLVLPRRAIRLMTHGLALSSMWLLKAIAGTKSEFRGVQNIPSGGYIVASKHQSMWETFALYPLFEDGIFVYKRELKWVPLFGWYLQKLQMIPVDRNKGSKALQEMNEKVLEAIRLGRQILLFPEGTRKAPDATPDYKYGVVHIYHNSQAPILPIALNAGVFWPRRRFLRYPGMIVAQCLPMIEAGLPRAKLLPLLQERIETTTAQLVQEARAKQAQEQQALSSNPS